MIPVSFWAVESEGDELEARNGGKKNPSPSVAVGEGGGEASQSGRGNCLPLPILRAAFIVGAERE
jgi:hypothetical protein